MAMVDFFYHGETQVYQENLDSFLLLAGELQLKGLRGNQTETEAEVSPKQTKQKSEAKSPKYRTIAEQFTIHKYVFNENELVQEESEKALALADEATNNSDLEILDQQVKSMMMFSENAAPHQNGRARICKVCGKEGSRTIIRNHIEARHIVGISIPCGLCGQGFRSRNALEVHKSRNHRSQ